MLAVVIGQGQRAYDDLVQLKALIQVMVDEQREPTADEWKLMEARSAMAYERIQGYDIDAEVE